MKTAFDQYIDRAVANSHLDLARRLRIEKRMASALVKACIARGFLVTIDNGEAVEIEKSKSYTKIMKAMFATDEEHLLIYDADGKRHGWFFLVYGNDGYDLVSDYSITDATEAIYNEVIDPLSDKIQAGG